MNRLELIDLFDLYALLLTDKEQEMFRLYYEEDLSLQEISENLNISKSAVGKTLKVVENKLNNYEKKLQKGLIKKELEEVLKENDLEQIKKRVTKIKNL